VHVLFSFCAKKSLSAWLPFYPTHSYSSFYIYFILQENVSQVLYSTLTKFTKQHLL